MYAAIGYGGITTGQILTKLINEYRKENKIEETPQSTQTHSKKTVQSGVIVKGYDDMVVRFAKCCNPVPGDRIVGYITRGRGVSVHRADCPNINLVDFEKDRMIDVAWAEDEKSSYNVEIQVSANDRHGLIAELTNQIYDMGYSITSVNARTGKNHLAIMEIGLEISRLSQLDEIITKLKKISGVRDVFRINK